jgi:outer membrane lipoprotein SlyB
MGGSSSKASSNESSLTRSKSEEKLEVIRKRFENIGKNIETEHIEDARKIGSFVGSVVGASIGNTIGKKTGNDIIRIGLMATGKELGEKYGTAISEKINEHIIINGRIHDINTEITYGKPINEFKTQDHILYGLRNNSYLN